MIIRDALLPDLDAIVDIYNSTVEGRMVTADLEPVSVESKVNWFCEHSPAFRPLWVVEQDGKIVAWVSFQSFYGRPAYRHTAEVSIYIAESSRGKGLGKLLLQRAIDACEGLEIKTLLGYIFGHNEPSLKLFEKFGFTHWGIFPRIAVMDDIERDLIIAGKRVSE